MGGVDDGGKRRQDAELRDKGDGGCDDATSQFQRRANETLCRRRRIRRELREHDCHRPWVQSVEWGLSKVFERDKQGLREQLCLSLLDYAVEKDGFISESMGLFSCGISDGFDEPAEGLKV